MSNPTRINRPGKFEGELALTAWVYEISLHGGENDRAGSVQDAGMYASLLLNLRKKEGDAEWHELELTEEDAAFLAQNPHCILFEDDQGFVSSEWFASKEEALTRWQIVKTELDAYLIDPFADEEEESDE